MTLRSFPSLPRLGGILLAGLLLVGGGWRPATAVRADAEARAGRVVLPLDPDWRFARGDFAGAAMPAFDDSAWRRVDLPHDWSAEGPFSAEFASGSGFAPGGLAWYRKHVVVPPHLRDRLATIEFDGVYDHAEVWVNGQLVGGRPYGYSSFQCVLSPHLRTDGGDNVIAVRVDHTRFADSRWYTGSGIYRHVRLCFREAVHITHWGTSVTTPAVSADAATVKVETTVENTAGEARGFDLESEVVRDGRVVARVLTPGELAAEGSTTLVQEIQVARPERWSPDTPVLYDLRQRVRVASAVTDDLVTPFGIRTIRFDAQRGFLLNDVPTKLKGVCLHHDAGSLGAAVPEAVWERRLRTLKEMGVNAIRTSHNPPAPELLDLCDRLGFLVKDEAFDEFTPPKNKWVEGWNEGQPAKFGYGEMFDTWALRDLEDMVRRDRNHPSIVMWSIGNELDYPNDPFSHPALGRAYRPTNPPARRLAELARPLAAAVRKLDPTRPVTAALASLLMSEPVGLPGLLDIVGYNYQEARYADDHARVPTRVIFGSENNHRFASWAIVRDNPWVAGQFLWTGIDYLGEARLFPARANGAGLLDLCGFKKPLAWFRQSLWSDKPMVYLAASPAVSPSAAAGTAAARPVPPAEHWNWQAGAPVRVSCYTTCSEVTLTLNGKPVGTKRAADAVEGVLTWELPYQPGVLKAVGRVNGKAVVEHTLTTAGAPARLALVPVGSGEQVREVQFEVQDARGVRVPDADTAVHFALEGPARILGIGNGNLSSLEDARAPVHKAYEGRGLVTLRLTAPGGPVRLTASAPGLPPVTLTITSSW